MIQITPQEAAKKVLLDRYNIPHNTVEAMLSVAPVRALDAIANQSGVFTPSFFEDLVLEQYYDSAHPELLVRYAQLWSEKAKIASPAYLHRVLASLERDKLASGVNLLDLRFNS